MSILFNSLHLRKSYKLPIILQDEIAECGHACIAMIGVFFGHNLDLSGLRKISEPSIEGISLSQINKLLTKLSFKTRALRVPIDKLNFVKTPAILHWNKNHFVVLKKVKRNKIIIHDPAIGVRIFSYEEFQQGFSGVALEVTKDIEFKSITSKNKITLLQIIKTIPNIHKLFGILLLLSLSIEILTIINPLFIQYITDQVLGSNSTSNLFPIASGFILIICLLALSEYTRSHLTLYTTTNFRESFGAGVFRHLLSLSTKFFSNRHQGDIQSKFQSIENIQSKISSDFINTILDGVMFFITLTVMFLYSSILSVLVLVTTLIFVAIRYFSYQTLKNQTSASAHLHAKVATTLLETIRAITPIKLFLKEQNQLNSWRDGYIDALNSDIKISKQQITYQISNHFIFNLEQIIIICIGAKLVLSKQFSTGMLLAFLAYRHILVIKATSFIQNIFDYKLLSIQLNRLNDILVQEPEINDNQYKQINDQSINTISLKNISFQYNQDKENIINNLNLEICKGEKIAIIGKSGCGKSTLLNLMMGLLSPTSGQIYINNLAINTFGIMNYRKKIAAVMQQDSLLTGTILNNITFFDDQIDIDLVHEATNLAQIHEMIIKLPMGYETLVGDMGSILSGGQKQRLILARALYKKPDIIFLDEATSHLDDENERLINQALKTINITQVVVAHRQETIKMADRVIEIGVT
jgi:ATP-binding cassette subfamily B protein RaxB